MINLTVKEYNITHNITVFSYFKLILCIDRLGEGISKVKG